MHRNRSVDVHQFAMVPRADIPRSSFNMQTAHKTTFDSGYLIPVYCEELLPGDSFKLSMTGFARLATPIFPIMDNMTLSSFFFFVPNRLTWDHWRQFNGQQRNPGDSTDFLVPQIVSPADGYVPSSIFDYFGLPTVGQVTAGRTVSHNALPLRAYNLIYNEWFRDENLQNSVPNNTGDGPDSYTDYTLLRRGKRHDYFTSCLPWPQKGTSVTLPLGTSAPIRSGGYNTVSQYVPSAQPASVPPTLDSGTYLWSATGAGGAPVMYADLTQATAATINQLRQSFAIQRLLERDARGGTRYTEIIRAHFGVISPDARQQRPEYLGGGTAPIIVNPIAQTSGSGATGTTTPLGNLAAMGTMTAHGHGFTYSATEHGYVIGLISIQADLSYQQGMRKLWSRRTRFDFYWPAFSHLGEQVVYNKEIYCTGVPANDDAAFGYQERWAEYRYHPSMITSLFRSTTAGTLDAWHLAQRFTSLPTLNSTFIEDRPPVDRVVAVGAAANGKQFICDMLFNIRAARPMPMYSVPGLIDHF